MSKKNQLEPWTAGCIRFSLRFVSYKEQTTEGPLLLPTQQRGSQTLSPKPSSRFVRDRDSLDLGKKRENSQKEEGAAPPWPH